MSNSFLEYLCILLKEMIFDTITVAVPTEKMVYESFID